MDVYTLLVYLLWRIYRVNVQTPAKRNLVKGCKRITFVKHTNCIIQGGDNTWWLTNDPPVPSWQFKGSKKYTAPYVHTLFPRIRYPFRIFAFATFITWNLEFCKSSPQTAHDDAYVMHYQLFINQLSKRVIINL